MLERFERFMEGQFFYSLVAGLLIASSVLALATCDYYTAAMSGAWLLALLLTRYETKNYVTYYWNEENMQQFVAMLEIGLKRAKHEVTEE